MNPKTEIDMPIEDSIDQAAAAIGRVWPLHSFVTANPLAGFEDQPFHEAIRQGDRLFDADGYPDPDTFRRAWEDGRIDPDILESCLATHGYTAGPDALLERMSATGRTDTHDTDAIPTDRVDHLMTKWLPVFLDQGQAHWSMPDRDRGFYAAVRSVAPHDRMVPDDCRLTELPDDPVTAIETLLDEYPPGQWSAIFEYQLSALPGWTGLIKQRIAADRQWQEAHPITLSGYLAVRLALAGCLDAPLSPPDGVAVNRTTDDEGVNRGESNTKSDSATDVGTDGKPLPAVWLSAWEASYREQLAGAVADASAERGLTDGAGRPDAQFVFCIDTRSEPIRRHIERAGEYETHGYAGFFGVPMRHEGYDTEAAADACPPILDPQHRITDQPVHDENSVREEYDRWAAIADAAGDIVETLKSNVVTAYSFVETAGAGYGAALAARTLLPGRVYDLLTSIDERAPDVDEFCEPSLDSNPAGDDDLPKGLTLEQQVEYAATAFELMGWEQFARIVVFAGHASSTSNNPFESSLDCGACAGNSGGPNARVLAAVCNDEAVRAGLQERGFNIPHDTVFVAGLHDTTTSAVTLYDSEIPQTHTADIERLKHDLERAQASAAAERAGDLGVDSTLGVAETERRAADWAETRPEWGLAGNAGFVIGPRSLTEGVDLDARSFLHSYDWTTDPDGKGLETILTGPMIVTQWINAQYYFATVDTAAYGSGSKVTHNPVGNVGVYQGNGGDLMAGLPVQSVRAADAEAYHQPLRLSTIIHAPVDRVTAILAENDDVTELLDNDWLSVTVVDPQQNHRLFEYDEQLQWTVPDGQPAE